MQLIVTLGWHLYSVRNMSPHLQCFHSTLLLSDVIYSGGLELCICRW